MAALALETFSRPVRDREEITSLFPVPVLAALPVVPGANRSHGVAPWDVPPHVFEQIRMLRVQLTLSGTKRVIMVTSAGVGDGKTTVAAALATAFSEAGRTVMAMDLDLRKPHLAELLGVAYANGATQARRSAAPVTCRGSPASRSSRRRRAACRSSRLWPAGCRRSLTRHATPRTW